jgi:hypothetical protein
VTGFGAYPTPSSDTHTSLPKIITLGETPLLIPSVRDPGAGASPLQDVFHSATTDSRAVLADTLRGGTKIDLTAILAGTLPTTKAVSTIPNYPVKNTNIIPSIKEGTNDTTTLVAPKWDTLKVFNDHAKKLLCETTLDNSISAPLTAANGVLYVVTDETLYALAKP